MRGLACRSHRGVASSDLLRTTSAKRLSDGVILFGAVQSRFRTVGLEAELACATRSRRSSGLCDDVVCGLGALDCSESADCGGLELTGQPAQARRVRVLAQRFDIERSPSG